MSNPNQFDSPSNQFTPGQDPPGAPSQYQNPSYQGADGQQAAGYQHQQYGQPYQAPGAMSPDGYGTAYQGQQNPQASGYQYQQYQSPAGAASYGYTQPDPSYDDKPTPPVRQKKRSFATTALTVLAVVVLIVFFLGGSIYDFGKERLVWTAVASALGILLAIGCLIGIPVSFREWKQAKAAGNNVTSRMRLRGLFFAIIVFPLSGYFSLAYGLPAAQDLVEGPQVVTVTSCTYEQGSHRKSRRRGGGRTVYDNYFTMTLDDGTLRTTKIETDQPTSIQTMGGTYEVLYQACKLHSGSASMTLDVYEHSWIIVDARLN